MSRTLVLTAIGNDRPGLVEEISTVLTNHEGNWLDSSMARLAGKFAGVLTVEVPDAQEAALLAALSALASLRVSAEPALGTVADPGYSRRLSFSLVGHDRIGIVREVSQVFARHQVNVDKLNTWTSTAPMSSEILFHAAADLRAGDTLDADALKADLERVSSDLIVDIDLDEQIG
ncbi:MAG: ACT domain-containing protein [Rhodocyclaceae bacterium]|jgi:glycine cleavage system regulatory protein|nr:ACT domain-containing protein [Rhodocyclaceae bacterium]